MSPRLARQLEVAPRLRTMSVMSISWSDHGATANCTAVLIAVGVTISAAAHAMAQESNQDYDLFYADPAGWKLSLTEKEVDFSEVKMICEPACGNFRSLDQLDETLDRLGSLTGCYFRLYRVIYKDWFDEEEHIRNLNKEANDHGLEWDEKPMKFRYLCCALDLPAPGSGKRIRLNGDERVIIKVIDRDGQPIELTSLALLGTSDKKEQRFCWDSRKRDSVTADPEKFLSKGNTIMLFATFPDVFEIENIQEVVKVQGFQVVRE